MQVDPQEKGEGVQDVRAGATQSFGRQAVRDNQARAQVAAERRGGGVARALAAAEGHQDAHAPGRPAAVGGGGLRVAGRQVFTRAPSLCLGAKSKSGPTGYLNTIQVLFKYSFL